ncbi:MAG: metal ABC transporter substrate-binding protein [Candidatus Eisenbacteria bacterium]
MTTALSSACALTRTLTHTHEHAPTLRHLRHRAAAALVCFAALVLALAFPVDAGAKVRVVASLTDLGSIAAAVGGDQVDVNAIARPNTDPHRVEVLPSYMVRVSRADLYLEVGLGLDTWARQIIDGSHNGKVRILDCSTGIEPLEKPTGRVDASMGDVHPDGNPHYWLDPENGGRIAGTIADALAEIDPAHAADYRARASAFAAECAELKAAGVAAAQSVPQHRIVTYHSSWAYLVAAYGFEIAGTVEPVPGIPPTARHLQELVDIIRADHIVTLLAEPYFGTDATDFLAREAGVTVHRVSPSCDDARKESYLEHARELVSLLTPTAVEG